MFDKYNVTFGAFFKAVLILLPASLIYVTTITPAYLGRNCLILSLFLMLCLAFAYVILLYVVMSKLEARVDMKYRTRKDTTIDWIYGTRMAVKSGIILFILSDISRRLMLKKYSDMVIAIPILLVAAYMGNRGFKGLIRFYEAVFWFSVVSGIILFVSSVKNLDLGELRQCVQIYGEGSVGDSMRMVMVKGGVLFLGVTVMETVMMIYLGVNKRRRGMLFSAVGISVTIGIIGSIFVISTLGMSALEAGTKDILYVVGAMELPNGIKIRPLMLVCYLVLTCGISLLTPQVVCGFGAVTDLGRRRHSSWLKLAWLTLVFAVCVWLWDVPAHGTAMRLAAGYIMLVDVPLSLILPAVVVIGRKPLKKATLVLIAFAITAVLPGCAYNSVESVDYANVLVIEPGKQDGMYKYTLVITGLSGDEDKTTEERKYTAYATSFSDVRANYDKEHARQLDVSHVEYLAADNEQVLNENIFELGREFATSYVTVVVDRNILEKSGDNNTKDYLKTHYRGRCLATLGRHEGDYK